MLSQNILIGHKLWAEPKHSPDGKKRGGADAASFGGPLVMQVVMFKRDEMEITLLRHGKPDIPSLKKLSASAFCKWIKEYNVSVLSKASKPTREALACARECNAIVCSNMPRSIDSGSALNAGKVVLSASIFNEAGLPSANWRRLKLSPNLWAVFFRVLWLLGYSRNAESFKEAKTRAAEAVVKLTALARPYPKSIFFQKSFYIGCFERRFVL